MVCLGSQRMSSTDFPKKSVLLFIISHGKKWDWDWTVLVFFYNFFTGLPSSIENISADEAWMADHHHRE